MRTYDKRIGFLVSYQTLVPHGGIGQFAKSFCELMDSHNIKVDIITDKKPQDSEFVKSLKANVLSPLKSLKYTDHSNIFMYGDTFCYERMANFRNSIVEALEYLKTDADKEQFLKNSSDIIQYLENNEIFSIVGYELVDVLADQVYKGLISSNTQSQVPGRLLKIVDKSIWYDLFSSLDTYEEVEALYDRKIIQLNDTKRYAWVYMKKLQ